VRRELGGDVLQSRRGGYVLTVDPADVDASRFEALAEQGREALRDGQPVAALQRTRPERLDVLIQRRAPVAFASAGGEYLPQV
jgi:hypothetical protein